MAVLITNTTKGDLGLTPALVIPAGETVPVDKDALAAAEKSAVVAHYFETEMLTKPKAPKSSSKKADD